MSLAFAPAQVDALQDKAIILPASDPKAVLVFLHGMDMAPEVLFPFAAALSLPAVFCIPYGQVKGPQETRSWWAVDAAKRRARLASGPSDLFDRHPKGRFGARGHLQLAIRQVGRRWPGLPLYLAGYSQGAMLALDYTLLDDGPKPDALVLLSGTCIALDEWSHRLQAKSSPVRDMPVLVMHGESDQDLALSAGQRLRDCLVQAKARVQWKQFDGGHEMSPVVWRSLRRFVVEQVAAQKCTH